jgi:hypothetical protein
MPVRVKLGTFTDISAPRLIVVSKNTITKTRDFLFLIGLCVQGPSLLLIINSYRC